MKSKLQVLAAAAVVATGLLATAPTAAHGAMPPTTVAPGAYSLTGVAAGKQLDIAGVSVAAGAGVVNSVARGSAAQSWWVGQVSPGVYRLSNVNSGLCLHDPGTVNAQLAQQPCVASTNQRWELIPQDGGYELRNIASGRFADTSSGTAVTARAQSGTNAQRWSLTVNGRARVTTWASALTAGGRSFTEQTVRMVVRPTTNGNAQRLTFSNRFGTTPLTIGAATVGTQSSGLATTAEPGAVKFAGAPSVTIAPGTEVSSDPVTLAVTPGQNLVVSAYVQGSVASSSFHSQAYTTGGIASGNQTAASNATAFSTTMTSFFFLKSIDVISTSTSGTMVTLGDSITDGFGSTRDAFNSWPAQLAQKLSASGVGLGIANAGISSNRVTVNSTPTSLARGMSAVERFDYDVATTPGVTAVYLFEGINDVGDGVSSQQLIAGYQAIIAKARAAGLQVYGGTMTPFNGTGSYTAARENVRTTTNAWILSSSDYDAVVDFSVAVAKPEDPTWLLPANDSGDHIHLSPAGYGVLAASVAQLLQ